MNRLRRPPRFKAGDRLTAQLTGEPRRHLGEIMSLTKLRTSSALGYICSLSIKLYDHLAKPGAKIILRDGKGHEEELKLL